MADLYLLAASTYMIGAHYSSFPELAQRLAGPALPLETPANENGPPDLTDLSRPENPLEPHLRVPTSL